MRVVSVHIQNFRAIGDMRLTFQESPDNDRPITVLSGPNGSGKTTVLFAIVQALRGVMGYRTLDVPVPNRDDIRSPRSRSGKYVLEQAEIRVDLELSFDEVEQEAIPQLLRDLRRDDPPPLVDGKVTVRWSFPPGYDTDGNPRNWWNASVEPWNKNIRSWLQARKWAIQTRDATIRNKYLPRIGGIYFFPQDRNLLERVVSEESSPPSGGLAFDQIEGHDEETEPNRTSVRERTIAETLHYLSDYTKSRVPELPDDQNWENRIKKCFREICSPKEYVGYAWRPDDLEKGVPLLRDGEHEYPLSNAASGEHIILEYITRLTVPSPHERSVILVDEPEVHLHPAWVRRLYMALPKIGAANQYILTTHSAELRQRAVADNALIDLGDWSRAE